MSSTLKILAFLGTVTGGIANLGVIPVVPAHISVFVIALSLALHQLVDVIGDFLDNGKSDWRSPLVIGALLIGALSLAGLTGCSTALSSTGTASSPVTSSGASSTATAVGGTTAMQAWVNNNWLIFYDAGYYGAQAYVTFGVQHGSTRTQLAQDVLIANTGLNAAEIGGGVSATQIETAVTNAGGNVGTKTQNYAQIGAVLSPFLTPVLALLGGDVQATAEALALIVDGAAQEANSILGTPTATPTTNPYSF